MGTKYEMIFRDRSQRRIRNSDKRAHPYFLLSQSFSIVLASSSHSFLFVSSLFFLLD